jgi:hypothetical protein
MKNSSVIKGQDFLLLVQERAIDERDELGGIPTRSAPAGRPPRSEQPDGSTAHFLIYRKPSQQRTSIICVNRHDKRRLRIHIKRQCVDQRKCEYTLTFDTNAHPLGFNITAINVVTGSGDGTPVSAGSGSVSGRSDGVPARSANVSGRLAQVSGYDAQPGASGARGLTRRHRRAVEPARPMRRRAAALQIGITSLRFRALNTQLSTLTLPAPEL